MKTIFFSTLFLLLLACSQPKGPAGCCMTPQGTDRDNCCISVTFPSLDSLAISANLYHLNDTAPVIVLCHQARFNKFSYDGIAPQLMQLGFNCLAIDQRSGGPISSQQNETRNRALALGRPTEYLDAEQDIIAAVNYAYDTYQKPVILWGSSYSATLALYIALNNPKVAAVISFSPGNYFKDQKGSLTDLLVGFEKPFFLTSSRSEAPGVSELLSKMTLTNHQTHFIPTASGHHGSRALWVTQEDGEAYWTALKTFLTQIQNN